ncbi:MAG: DEAD/DEAH box helicase [Dehalococcoidia bacterium]
MADTEWWSPLRRVRRWLWRTTTLPSHRAPLGERAAPAPTEPPPDHAAIEVTAVRWLDVGLRLDDVVSANVRPADAQAHPIGTVTAAQPLTGGAAADGSGPAEPGQDDLLDRLRAALALPLDRLLPGEGSVIEWPGPLYPFQRDGVEMLIKRDRLLLADDMGLGKTVQAIAAIRVLIHQRRLDSALIVAPAGLLDQWRAEFERWAPELRVIVVRGAQRAGLWRYPSHVKVVSYETLRSDYSSALPQGHPLAGKWSVVVLDEAQRVKNRDTSTSATAKRLHRARSWAMTGTPLENRIEELASILEFVDGRGAEAGVHPPSTEQMLARHREVQLRRKKSDVLDDLPPKQQIRVMLELTAPQRAAYDRAEREGIVRLQAMGAEVRVQHVLELITRLKQLCNFEPTSGSSAKLDEMKVRIAELAAAGHRALIFTQYTGPTFGAEALAASLAEFHPLTYTGALSSRLKSDLIDAFRADPRHSVLILSLKAGGVGLNLQEASYVFHFDRWWNPATERQAEDRAHRMGQQYPVTVFTYTCAATIEERIERLLNEKQALFDEVVDDVSLAVDLDRHLSPVELFGLVGLEPPMAPTRH